MNTSNDLFYLIKSMSKQEKRYFKLHATCHSSESSNRYTILFDAIDRLEHYDEAKVCRAVAAHIAARNLASLKHKLGRLILNSLAAYNAGKSARAELRELMAHIELLYNRGLYGHCRKVIARARKKALQVEKFSVLIDILEWEHRLLLNDLPDSFEQDLGTIHRASKEVLERIGALSRYNEDLARLYALLHHNKNVKQGLQQSMPALQQEPDASQSLSARIVRSQTMSLHNWLLGEHEQALRHFRHTIELWDSNPAIIADRPGTYKRDLSNYLTCCFSLKHFDDFAETIQKIKDLPTFSLADEISVFKYVSTLELSYYLNQGMLQESLATVQAIDTGIKRFGDKIDPIRLISFYHNCSVACFLSGRYAEALERVNAIRNQERHSVRRDLQEFTRIFSLVLHFELGDYDILEAQFRSASRFFGSREAMPDFEKTLIRALKHLLNCADTASAAREYKALQHALTGILHAAAAEPTGLIELLFWTESKLSGKPIDRVYTAKMQAARFADKKELFPLE